MFSAFPALLVYQLFAPLILRVAVAYCMLIFGSRHVRDKQTLGDTAPRPSHLLVRSLGVFELLISMLLFVGLFTQVAALCAMLVLAGLLVARKHYVSLAPYDPLVYKLLFVTSLSLLFLGAGTLAFDLPL